MSEPSSDSDENYDLQDEKDDDFNIDDYHKDIGSDDSADIPETNNDDKDTFENNQGGLDEQEKDDYIGPVLPGGHRFDRKFICIKYPGNVVNPERAIATLGGISSISTAVNTPNRRLELKFRPDDAFSKPTCGDRYNTKGFLLRVRVKKSRVKNVEEAEADRMKKNVNEDNVQETQVQDNINTAQVSETGSIESQGNKDEEQVISELADQVQDCSVNNSDDIVDPLRTDLGKTKKDIPPTFDRNKFEDLSKDEEYELPKLKVLGRVDMKFKFTNLCDFQYLPMTQSKEDPKKLEYVYDKIYPNNIPQYSWLKSDDVPYFLPPAAFSRMDTIQLYVPKTEAQSYADNIIGKSTKRKSGFSNFIYFSTPDVPTKPPVGIETAMKVKFVQNAHYDQIRRLFEERPIWSKNAVMYKTKFSHDRLKILLPSVAYYFMTGPWKIMWVKLGYDPRKDITARKYQTLDYRLKAMHGLGSTIKCKRNYSEYTLPYKSTPVGKQKTVLSGVLTEQCGKKELELTESVYVYRDGTVPPSRQMFYQYCDVLVDEIQEMLAKLPDSLPTTRCHEKRGWLPSGFDAQCREIINKQVRTVLRKRMNIPLDYPTDIPKRRSKRGMKMKLNKLKARKKKKKNEPSEEVGQEKDDEVRPSTSTADN